MRNENCLFKCSYYKNENSKLIDVFIRFIYLRFNIWMLMLLVYIENVVFLK